jgi:hypothetical protein
MATDAVRHLLTTFTWLLLMMTVDSVAAVPVSTDAQALVTLIFTFICICRFLQTF